MYPQTKLVIRMRDKDERAKQVFIYRNIELVSKTCNKYKYKKGIVFDDVMQSGHYGFLQAVEWIIAGRCEHTNYRGYCVKTIKRFVIEAIVGKSIIKNGHDVVPVHSLSTDVAVNPTEKLSELVDHLGLTDYERNIVELRLQGRTFTEIGKTLGFSRQVIHLDNCKIKDKYNKTVFKDRI